jgi:VanZ family protein
MVLIFVLSSQSGLAATEDVAVERPLRGLAHLVSFGILAGLLLFALAGFRRPTLATAAVALGLATLYAVIDEWHQSMVPSRTGRAEDVLTDTVGALIGLIVAWVVLGALADRRRAEPGGV